MKTNANRFGVNPERIVLGGASAGGHLSMLAAYAPRYPEPTPEDVKDADLSVCGVLSYYGPGDLLAVYRHTNQQNLVGLPRVPIGSDQPYKRNMTDAGRLDILLGGHPQEAPQAYAVGSPIHHVHPGCPPTLLIQGEQDLITPVMATRELAGCLREAGVPVVNRVFPCTSHAFDLVFPQFSPPAQSALYDVDRFLALMAA